MLPIIIKSIQEQQTEVENLTGELLSLKKNLDDLKNENINLKQEKEENISLNKKSKLFQNQPNPFNTNSIIKLFVAENASIFSLNIYDINGIKVKSFNNLTLGDNVITINGGELKSGIFVYELNIDGNTIDTKQMIITN